MEHIDVKDLLGGGNSKIFHFHLYLGNIPFLTCAYFSDGLKLNHQLVYNKWPRFLGWTQRNLHEDLLALVLRDPRAFCSVRAWSPIRSC